MLELLGILSLTGIATTTIGMGAFSAAMPLLMVVGMVGRDRPAGARPAHNIAASTSNFAHHERARDRLVS